MCPGIQPSWKYGMKDNSLVGHALVRWIISKGVVAHVFRDPARPTSIAKSHSSPLLSNILFPSTKDHHHNLLPTPEPLGLNRPWQETSVSHHSAILLAKMAVHGTQFARRTQSS
jgi:hypothetical protein